MKASHADLALIAAAPELLAALRELLAIAAPHMTDDPQLAAMAQARAAIAKTEGFEK